MSNSIWLTIAMIIVPSAILAVNQWGIEFWKEKRIRTRLQAKSELSYAKARSETRESVIARVSGVVFGIVVPLALLVVAMTRSEPLNRWSVLTIAVGVGWIFLQIAVGLSVYISWKIWKAQTEAEF